MNRHRIILFIVTFILTALFSVYSFAEQDKYTLEDCIRTAKNNNYRIKELKLSLESAELRLKSAWNNIFPQLSFNMGYSDSKSYDFSTDLESLSNGYSANFSVSQVLFRSGYNWANIRKAQNSLKISELGYRQEESSLALRVKTKYYKVLQDLNLVKMRHNDVRRKQDNAALIKLKYQVGNEKKTNLDQAELDLETANYDLLDAQESLKISIKRLNIEIGNDPDAVIELNDEMVYSGYKYDEAEALKQAFELRPDFKQKELSIRSAELDRVTARSDLLPSASLSAGYSWAGDNFFPERSGWNTRLSVSFPILSGFPLYTGIKDAKTNLETLLIDIKQMQKSIAVDVHEASVNLMLADKNVRIKEKALGVARNREILSRMEYSQGKLSYLEFEDTELRLTQAEISYIQSLYQFEISKASFENTIGK